MPNEEVILEGPYIRLDTGAASMYSREERLFAPIVIVRMTRNGVDVSRDVGWPVA